MENKPHLKPYRFQPGQSGNPGGRPKKLPVTEEYLAMANEPVPEPLRERLNKKAGKNFLPKGVTFARAMALQRWLDALEKSGTQAAREITDRIEGKAAQRIEMDLMADTPLAGMTLRVSKEEPIQ